MEKQATNMNYQDYLFGSFYKSYSGGKRRLTEKDEKMLGRLARMCCPYSYDQSLNPTVVRKALREAKRTGKSIRIVPDRQFWKNGSCCDQQDGWSYHLVLYTPQNTVNDVHFRKNHRDDRIWWVDNTEEKGKWEFSFDRVKIYNMYQDYPYKLTKEEKELFDKENPFWKEYFKDRQPVER